MKVKLLKDLPDLKAGAIFKTITQEEYNEEFYEEDLYKPSDLVYLGKDEFQKFPHVETHYAFELEIIVNNPDWFEIIELSNY
jgi:hypothetical protein